MAVPPGVSERDFAAALDEFRAAVGADWVFTSDEDVALYRDFYSPYWGEPEERVASAAVAPSSVEQVQAVVRAANARRIPLYSISTGRNLAYGGSAPVLSGSVVLDLKRMNRVIEVDERNAYALVEPGVTYFDLYNYIEEHGFRLWIDPPDPGWGSVVGNALDGGGGYTASPFRDHFAVHCGMEVVLADGEIVRTGMGAVPNAKTWQQNRWGYGPWVNGLFRQGNMGIVTKMGFWLMPRPEAYIEGTVQVFNDSDITPLLDTLNLLENQHVVNGSTQLGGGGAFGAGDGRPAWTLTLPIFGPERVIRAQLDHARERFAAIEGARFVERDLIRLPLSAEDRARVRLVNFGIPNLEMFAILGRSPMQPNPPGGHIGFSPIIPRTGEELLKFRDFYRANLAQVSGGETLRLIGPIFMTSWERSLVALILFPVSKDATFNGRIRVAFERWVHLAAEQGWVEYRAPAVFQNLVAETYSYNNHALRRLQQRIKNAVDPNGILAAGRYGVWPNA